MKFRLPVSVTKKKKKKRKVWSIRTANLAYVMKRLRRKRGSERWVDGDNFDMRVSG